MSGAARLTRVLRERRGFASTGTSSSGCHGLREMGYRERERVGTEVCLTESSHLMGRGGGYRHNGRQVL